MNLLKKRVLYLGCMLAIPTALAERIITLPELTEMLPDSTGTALFQLADSATPLLGYSLELEIHPLSGATGTVEIDASRTNFFEPRNVILAAGHSLDPIFSIVQATATGGVFINALSSDGVVLAAPLINDILAELYFVSSPEASGEFAIVIGSGTAIADSVGSPIQFETSPGLIRIVPEPNGFLLAIIAAVLVRTSRKASYSCTYSSTRRSWL